jgi:chemotaxis-related protein WspB
MLFIVFRIGGSRFALAASHIERVLPLLAIRSAACTAGAIAGVCNFHGEAVPVFDLSQLAGLAPATKMLSTRLLIVRSHGKRVALLVEGATETAQIDPARFSLKSDSEITHSREWLGGFASHGTGFIQRVEVEPLIQAIQDVA